MSEAIVYNYGMRHALKSGTPNPATTRKNFGAWPHKP
jgi:hypothetical protein